MINGLEMILQIARQGLHNLLFPNFAPVNHEPQ